MELVDEMSENNVTSATIEWTVDVTDGIDTVTADNAPFTLNVDGSDALGALAEQLIPQVLLYIRTIQTHLTQPPLYVMIFQRMHWST